MVKRVDDLEKLERMSMYEGRMAGTGERIQETHTRFTARVYLAHRAVELHLVIRIQVQKATR
jgi:hypothetical protein